MPHELWIRSLARLTCKQPPEVFTYVASEKSLFLTVSDCDSSGIVSIAGYPSETLVHALKQEMFKWACVPTFMDGNGLHLLVLH